MGRPERRRESRRFVVTRVPRGIATDAGRSCVWTNSGPPCGRGGTGSTRRQWDWPTTHPAGFPVCDARSWRRWPASRSSTWSGSSRAGWPPRRRRSAPPWPARCSCPTTSTRTSCAWPGTPPARAGFRGGSRPACTGSWTNSPPTRCRSTTPPGSCWTGTRCSPPRSAIPRSAGWGTATSWSGSSWASCPGSARPRPSRRRSRRPSSPTCARRRAGIPAIPTSRR